MARLDGSTRVAEDRSVAELSGDLVRELGDLIHHELEMATLEVTEKGKRAGMGAGALGAASVLALIGLGCLAAGGIAALSLVLPVWASALVMGGAVLLVAAIAATVGKAQIKAAAPPVPEKAVQSTKEDVAWLKQQARSARR